MTLSAVAADQTVTASLTNQLIAHVNASRGRAVFTANGSWSVPNGVHQFIVYLAGGGGNGGDGYHVSGDAEFDYAGGPGGDSPLCSKVLTGVEVGTTFAVTIGAGGATGGTSTFGALLTSTGGAVGPSFPGTGSGARGTHTGTLAHMNGLFVDSTGLAYGAGGAAGYGGTGGPGAPGICVIEW